MSRMAVPGSDELDILRSFARRIDPSDAGAFNNLGVLYYRKGLTEEAVAAFSRALALDERMRVARRNLEIAYGESEATRRTLERLRSRLSHNPGDLEALVQSGIAEKTGGDLQRAQQLFERALEVDPRSSVLHYLLAETLYNRGLSDDALRSLRRSIEIHPENPDAHYLLGFVLGDLGLNDEAAEANRRALVLNPTLTRAQANLSLETYRESASAAVPASGGEGATQVALALAYREKGYHGEALRAYERALQWPESRAPALHGMLELHLVRGDAAAAVDAGAKLTEQFPATSRNLNDYGVAVQMTGDHAKAEELYRASLALDEHYQFAHNNLGVVLWHNGDPRGAVNSFRRALQAEPCPIESRLNLALALFRQKHFDLALEANRQVLRHSPEHPVAWNGIGLILVDLGRFEEARNAFARAIQSHPDFAEAHYNMSFTLSRLGDFNGALRETKQALALDPIYSAQKLSLAIELPLAEAALFVGPALVDASDLGQGIPDFRFDPAILEEIFAPGVREEEEAQNAPPGSFSLARDYLSKGMLHRAQAEIARVVGRGGDRLEGFLLAGESFRAQGLDGEALERFRSALELDGENRAALQGAARSLLAMGRADEALAMAAKIESGAASAEELLTVAEARIAAGEKAAGAEALAAAIEMAGVTPADDARAAALYASLDDHARAAELLRRSIEAEPSDPATHVALARALVALADDGAAEAELARALELHPGDQAALLEMAALRRRAGQPREAMRSLVHLLRTDIYHFDALLGLGETLAELGRESDARRAYERVIRFDPAHESARAHLDGLAAGAA